MVSDTYCVSVTLLGISLVLVTFSVILLIRQWNSPLLVARGRPLLMLAFLGTVFMMIEAAGDAILGTELHQLVLSRFIFSQALAFIGVPLIIKSFILLGKFKISSFVSEQIGKELDHVGRLTAIGILSNHQHSKIRLFSSEWFLKHRWILFHPAPSCIAYISLAIICLIPGFVYKASRDGIVVNLLLIILQILIASILFRNFESRHDKWGIRAEGVVVVFVSVLLLANWFVHEVIARLLKLSWHLAIRFTISWAIYVSIMFATMTVPCIKSEILERKVKNAHSMETKKSKTDWEKNISEEGMSCFSENYSLRKFLQNPIYEEAFRKHLEDEFSVENLAFCKSVQQFKNLISKMKSSNDQDESIHFKRDIVVLFKEIYLEYIPEYAPSQVNLPHIIVESLKLMYSEVANNDNVVTSREFEEIFDSSEQSVVEMMERDSFARFKLSRAFKNLPKSSVAAGSTESAASNSKWSVFLHHPSGDHSRVNTL